ncbi:MAG: P-loop NTPase [Actinomycetota bacterium]|nr:P-loop NTPase [Actinomycetota bacterium]MDZ4177893.1 P-loop NTPase [Coriobacteriia bacterium]
MGLAVLCDTDKEFVARLEKVLSGTENIEYIETVNPAEAADIATEKDAWIVVFGPSTDRDAVLAAGARIAVSSPRTVTLLMSRAVGADQLRAAMRAGFRDVVEVEGTTYGDLAGAVAEAYEAAATARGTKMEHAGANARVVTVFSTKGGVGKSVIASNLAAILASGMDKRVVLLDLDLESGDGAVMLGLEPTSTIYDAIQAYERLDAQLLEGYMREHSSGVKVLLAPVQPEQAESVTTARVAGIITLAREIADVVVIDTPGRLDETVLTAIDKSDQVLAIATMDLPSIKNTKISLAKLRQLGYRNGLVNLVLNRADSKVLLEPADVERAIGASVLARIPSDRLVPRSVNRGVPVALDQPKSAVAKSMVELARLVVGG